MYKYLINQQEVEKVDFEKSVLNSRIIETGDDLALTFIRALIQTEYNANVQNEVVRLVANFETIRLFSKKNPITIVGTEYGIMTVEEPIVEPIVEPEVEPLVAA